MRLGNLVRTVTLGFVFGCSTYLNAQPPTGPTEQHAKLEAYVGKWDFELKTSDGNSSKGKTEYKSECGGLWITSDFRTTFSGFPFQGKGLDGYDPVKKKYVSVWVDSMTPAPMMFSGDYDKDGVLHLSAEAAGPDGQLANWRSVSKWINPDEHVFEMFLTPKGGTEASMMTIRYKRTK
jgi:hypothetical protein